MKISAAFPPVPATPEHIGLAEKLGYSTAWVYDTPALQLDCWMTLALAAARTSRIRLGPGVMIPSLRHPMVTASAIATLVSLVGESRVIIGIGTGFTGRRAMGQKPLRWQDMPRMVGDIRRLLAGETVEIEGAATSMLHWPGQAPNRAIDRQVITGEAMSVTPLVCKPAELPERLDRLATQGITEVAFQPMGDVTRELTTFARAAGLQRAT